MNYERLMNSTLQELKPSGIRKFFDIAAEMEEVISLSVGEPDFSTPWHIRQEAIATLEKGRTWYSPNAGFIALREAIADYVSRHNDGLTYDPQTEVVVTVGGSEAIDLMLRALVTSGDEVLIPDPCFVCYEPLTRLAGGVPVMLKTRAEDAFRLTAETLRAAITPRTKLLILPYPNNPTGAIMPREELEQIAEVLRGTDIMVLSDEIYSELTYGRKHVSIASIEGMRERTILVSGFSKAFAMTGWRLGYACGPAPVMGMMLKLHQYAIMCAPTTAQYAAIEAMKNGDTDVESMRDEYDMRRRFIVDELNRIGLTCFEPEGAFYVFPCIRSTGMTSEEFCTRLLQEKHVAVVPGTAFGESGEGFVRISYCYSIKHITEALRRMAEFLKEHGVCK